MAQKSSTFLDELVNAAHGCFALLSGNREAPTHFDFSQRGLMGSLIAILAAMAISSFVGVALSVPQPTVTATQMAVTAALCFVGQTVAAYVALRQMGRLDGLVPYLVASNWVAFALSAALIVATLLGPIGFLLLVAIVVASLVTFINIGRLIVTLSPLQIAILFVSEAVGVVAALIIVGVLLPPPHPL